MKKLLRNLYAIMFLLFATVSVNGQNACGNFAGAMPQAFSPACFGDFVNSTTVGQIIEPGYQLFYVLHNGVSSIGTVEAYTDGTVPFTNDGSLPQNQNLTISAVVTSANPDGSPNLLDPCADVSTTSTPVRFYTEIIITPSYTCDPLTGLLSVSFSVNGGAPAFPEPNGFIYTIAGDYNGQITNAGGSASFTLSNVTDFTISVLGDGKGCTATVTETVNCFPCNNDAGTAQAAAFLCSNETGTYTNTGINADASAVVAYALHTGSNTVGNILEVNSTGSFTNDGSYPTNSQLYVSAIVGTPDASGVPDLNDVCTVVALPGTPLIFLEPISVASSTSCDGISGETTVTFTATGGFPSFNGSVFTVSGDYAGTTSANQVNTFTLAQGTGTYNFSISDMNGCVGAGTGTYDCQGCFNETGTSPAGQTVCDGGSATGTTTGSIVDPSSNLVYALHDGFNSVGNIYDVNSSGVFDNGTYPVNTQLYITPFAGVLQANGLPDLADACTDAGFPGTPVVFLTPVSLTSTTSCDDVSGVTTVSITVGGGAPMFNNSTYVVSGTFSGNAVLGQTLNFTVPMGSGTYDVTATDLEGCTANTTGTYDCVGCMNEAGTPAAAQILCAGEMGDMSHSGVVIDSGSVVVYALHDGSTSVGNIIETNSTGIFDNNGSYPTDVQLYVSAIVGELSPNGLPDITDPCSDIQLPGSPVIFLTPIDVVSSTTCDGVTGTTTVEFTVTGGQPAYDGSDYAISGDYVGASTDGQTITFTVPEGAGNLGLVVTDISACSATEAIAFDCDGCDNFAGTPAAAQTACTGQTVDGTVSDAVIDSGSALIYILHTGSTTNILDVSSTGTFMNNGTWPLNQTLYISSAVGEIGASGLPDFNDPCTDINLPGTPINFYGPIVINDNFVCDPVTGFLTVTFTVSGGEAALGGNYTVTGSYNGTANANTPVSFSIAPGSNSYTLNVVDAAGCNAAITQPYSCVGCDNFAGISQAEQIVCSGATADGTTTGSIVDPGSSIVYVLHDGTPAGAITTSPSGQFVNNGTYPVNTQLYISAAVGVIGAGGLPDLNDPCSDINLPGTPVTFLSPVSITETVDCDMVSGITTITYSVMGGLPAFDGSTYTLTGDNTGTIGMGANVTYTIASGAGSYSLGATDGAGCSSTVSGNYNCMGCDNFAGFSNAPQFLCDGEDANGITSSPIIDPGSVLVYAIHNGTPASIVSTNNTGMFSSAGLATNTQYYISAVVGVPQANGIPDLNDPCTNVNLPGSPVVFLDPVVFSVTDECDGINGITEVTMSVSGGLPAWNGSAFNITGNYTGPANNNEVVIFTIPPGTGTATLSANDGNGCNTSTTFMYDCLGCQNDAGVMSQTLEQVCDGESVTSNAQGFSVSPGAGLVYALHTGSSTVGTIIDANSSGTFMNTGSYPTNTTLYISSVVATIQGGIPDLNDPCLDVALPGTPVIFLDPIEIMETGSCDMITGIYTVTFSVTGGASGTYNISGDYSGFASTGSVTFTDNGDGVIDLTVVDAAGCTASYSNTYNCMGCADNEGGVLPPGPILACAGESLSLTAVGANVGSGSVSSYLLHSDPILDSSNVVTFNETGVFTNSGYIYNQEYYVTCVVGTINPATGYPDLNDPCTDLSNTTVVGFLEPISIDHDFICDNNTGEYTVNFTVNGGGPAFPGSGHLYTISGDFGGVVPPGVTNTFGPLGDGDIYTINVLSDGKGCSASVISDPIQCDKLPIELIHFTGTAKPNGNLLEWSTAAEINNDFFTLERASGNQISFEKIATIDGAINSSEILTYDFLDTDAPEGISYYRLLQTDVDGITTAVGETVIVERSKIALSINNLFPNPATENLSIDLTSDTNDNVLITVYDLIGRNVVSETVNVNQNANIIDLDVSNLVTGTYFITIESEESTTTQKFVVE